jgi:hypothetical protein
LSATRSAVTEKVVLSLNDLTLSTRPGEGRMSVWAADHQSGNHQQRDKSHTPLEMPTIGRLTSVSSVPSAAATGSHGYLAHLNP